MEKVSQYTPLPTNLSSGYASVSNSSGPPLCSPSVAAEMVRKLMGAYRGGGKVEDPHGYVASIASVFVHYPERIVRLAADPFDGLPGAVKWYPDVFEVKAFCEKHMEPIRQKAKREAELRRTQALLAAPAPATTEERERAYRDYMERVRPQLKGEIAQTRAQAEEAAKKRLKELYHEGINGKGSLMLSAEAVELVKAKALARGEALV
jgi:hypothetical protein